MQVERSRGKDLDERLARQVCGLWEATWPKASERSLSERAAGLVEEAARNSEDEVFHLIREGERLLGLCRTFRRRIRFVETGQESEVLALAGVCVEREARGGGLGAAVVSDAFRRLEEGCGSLCLFQTGVPLFYQKLGAYSVANEFVNSCSTTDPGSNPWWEPWVMVYGERSRWRQGRVDLLGRGY